MQIDVDFAVWQALTVRRKDEDDTINNVLRRIMKLPTNKGVSSEEPEYFQCRGGAIPVGSMLRAKHHGKMQSAKVTEDGIVWNGKTYLSPSDAASHVTDYPTNGWKWWEIQVPGEDQWKTLSNLRKSR
ncbi:MAG: DUF2924 domain-containing protein [Planctomycetota bacterium]|nr:DUF2924 domain-containing protein [Planctomycetota bacterium]